MSPIEITREEGGFRISVDADAVKKELVAAGWVPPFNPEEHELSEHDFMELAVFAGSVESEGFGYAAEEYPPKFRDEALAAAISSAPMDRLKALLNDRREAVDRLWERDDISDLIDAHQNPDPTERP